jgi:CIC family chloride channel protein
MEYSPHTHDKTLGLFTLGLLSVLVGLAAGLGAVLFRGLIGLFHNLMFLGQLSVVYDANAHTPPAPWGPFVILVPVVGALGVVFVIQTFAPETRGPGVGRVLDAIYHGTGVIRPIVAPVKILASALSIGSGGSVGREGPAVQMGSALGSTTAQILKLCTWQRIALIAAGAGAAIAATLNTPIGAVLFVVEIMLQEVRARTLVPVGIAAAVATYTSRLFFGDRPALLIPGLVCCSHLANPLLLLSYAVLGVILGMVSTVYIESVYRFEELFKRTNLGYCGQHILGMLVVGVIVYLVQLSTGHYHVEGVGYATIQDILLGTRFPLYVLLLLFVLKLLVTLLTLGSGASGGIFSPALYLGATLGQAYGLVLAAIFPGAGINPPALAIAGMSGIVAGATGAVVTAIVTLFEMTLDYSVVVPMFITVAFSYGVRKMCSSESIYTLGLARRGHGIPGALRRTLMQ